VAPAGRAIIHPRLSRTEGVTWFLNDHLLTASSSERIELESGSYQLRCVAPSGQFAEVRFRVE
jgi:membrane carboxypeptidase/penicillin-binding protein PbpC